MSLPKSLSGSRRRPANPSISLLAAHAIADRCSEQAYNSESTSGSEGRTAYPARGRGDRAIAKTFRGDLAMSMLILTV